MEQTANYNNSLNNGECSNKTSTSGMNGFDRKIEIAGKEAPHDENEKVDDTFIKNFIPCKCISLVAQLVFVSLIASFLFGYNVSVLNTSKDFIIAEFNWCASSTDVGVCAKAKTYGTLVNAGVFIGATIGSFVGGKFLSYGRRYCIMWTYVWFILGNLITITAQGFWGLFLGRLIVGIGVGFSSVCVGIWISENSPKQDRGFWGVFFQLAITIGILTANLLGLIFGKLDESDYSKVTDFQLIWWRVMLGMGIIPALIGLFLMAFVYKYDTPYYLLEEGRENVARALVGEIYSKQSEQEKEVEFQLIKESVKEMKTVEKNSLNIIEAISKKYYRNVIIIGCFLSMGQQLTGINVVVSNSNLLYNVCGVGNDLKTILSVILTAVNVLMTFPSIFLIDRLGRKTLLIIGTLGQTAFLFIGMVATWVDWKSTVVGWIAIASTYLYIIFFAVAYGPILWVYLFEIFPIEIKKSAAGLAVAFNWIGAIVMVLPSDYYLDGNPTIVFTLFTVLTGTMLAFIIIFTKETKCRSIDNSPYFETKVKSRIEK